MSQEPLDPNKYHVLTKKNKIVIVVFCIIMFFIMMPLISFIYYKFAVTRPNQIDKELTFTVQSGETVTQIAQRLYETGAINSSFLFKVYVLLNDMQNNLQAGVYVIPAGTSTDRVAQQLLYGREDKTITFLEGWRMEQFAQEASKTFEKVDYAEFVSLAKEFEGALFPDTYTFNTQVTEQQLIRTLNETFNNKTQDVLSLDNLEKAGLTKEQALIFASIIEREVSNPEDKPIVAGILIKRWREGELIGADATTQYAVIPIRYGCNFTTQVCPNAEEIPNIEWWPNDLTLEEIQIQTPYNTRGVVDLPPTPISNPSLNSIEAVINYQDSPYYYYLHTDSGQIIYAKDLDEQNANVVKYL